MIEAWIWMGGYFQEIGLLGRLIYCSTTYYDIELFYVTWRAKMTHYILIQLVRLFFIY